MSTKVLNRRMDLVHSFKDGTHFLSMDTSYPVKVNGLVLKLFIATCTYKASDVKEDNAGIAFSIKTAGDVGSLDTTPLITDIKKSNVFNFNNDILKDEAFVEGDYVMAIIDIFNDKLYLCSQTDFAKLVNADDLADICNLKMFDLTEETADRLSMAVAFQKYGKQPIDYKEHFSFTRNGSDTTTDENGDNIHGDYTLYQLISVNNETEEIPVADTYIVGNNQISVFYHPFMYLSYQSYIGERSASSSTCYRLNMFNAVYGYLNNKFVNEFCFDYDYLKKYFLTPEGETKYSLYNDSSYNGSSKFTHFIQDSTKEDYNYFINTSKDYLGNSFGEYYGEIFRVRKSDGLLSVLNGGDFDLLYNSSDNYKLTIDCSGENSKFAGDRWGSPISNIKYAYYIKDTESYRNEYVLKTDGMNLIPMTKSNYYPLITDSDYKYTVSGNDDIINEPYLLDPYNKKVNNESLFTSSNKTSVFNLFKAEDISFNSPNLGLENKYYFNFNNDLNDFLSNKENINNIFISCLGINTPQDIKFKNSFKTVASGSHGRPVNINNEITYNFKNSDYNRIFIHRNGPDYITTFVCLDLIKVYSNNSIKTTTPHKFLLYTKLYNFRDNLFLAKDSNNRITVQLIGNNDILNSSRNSLNYPGDGIHYYELYDDENSFLTLYKFLSFRIFGKGNNIDRYGISNKGAIDAISTRYRINSSQYSDIYIKFFSSIYDNTNSNMIYNNILHMNVTITGDNTNYIAENIYIANSTESKIARVFIDCKTNTDDCILSLAVNTENNTINSFSTEISDINNGSSFCIRKNGTLINPNNNTFTTNHQSSIEQYGIMSLSFDNNAKLSIKFITNNTTTNLGSVQNIEYNGTYNRIRINGDTNLILQNSSSYIKTRSKNYRNDDRLLISSTDDFFILDTDNPNNYDFVTYNRTDGQYYNSIANNKEYGINSTRINDFFEDGTLCNRNYGLPFICEPHNYYGYLKYIKTHSCLELFNTYQNPDPETRFGQLLNNDIDQSMYLDEEGNERTIYEFYKRLLKYNCNGTVKTKFPSVSYGFISKKEVDKTITDCSDHNSTRPHHFLLFKDTKDTLDIKGTVVDSRFVSYSDNSHGDSCYVSTTDKSNKFYQYVYIKKDSGYTVNLVNNNTEVNISINGKHLFTIGNSFNLYNTAKKSFTMLNNSDTIVLYTEVPVGNIYYLYLENTISEVNDIISDEPLSDYEKSSLFVNNTISLQNGDTIFINKSKKYTINNQSIIIGLDCNKVNDITYGTRFCSYSNNDDSMNNIYWYTDCTKPAIFGEKKILRISKILPSVYFFSIGEKNKDTGKFEPSSFINFTSNYNANNILSSDYITLPKLYQSDESNIYKTVVETGLRQTQSIALTDDYGNALSLNGIEKKEVDTLNWYDLLIALNNNQYIDILGEDLINLKKTLSKDPDIIEEMSDLTGVKDEISDIKNNILAKLNIIKIYNDVHEISIPIEEYGTYDLIAIIDNMQELSILDLRLPERENLIKNNKYYKDINVPYYQTISDVMNDTKVYGGHLIIFKINDSKIYLKFINKGNDIYFNNKANIITDFNDPAIWTKKNSPKVYSEINTNLDYNKQDFINTLSEMNPNSTLDITFPFNDDINNLDKTSSIYAGAMIFEANSRANPNFNYQINVNLECLDEDDTNIQLTSVRTDCSGMTEAILRYLGYTMTHSPDTVGIKVADFYQITDGQNPVAIKDKDGKTSRNFTLIPYSKDNLLYGDFIIYSARHIEQYIYTDSNGVARGFNAGSTNGMSESVSLAKYIVENKSIPEFSSCIGSTLNINGLNIGLNKNMDISDSDNIYMPDYILRYRYQNGNNFLPYSLDNDGYLEPGGHLVINALKPDENIINVNVEFTNYRNDKYSKEIIINKIGDLTNYCTFKWLPQYINMNRLNTLTVNWHDAIMDKPTLTDDEKKTKTDEYKAEYEKLSDDDKKKYKDADEYSETMLKEYIDNLEEVVIEEAIKEVIYNTSEQQPNLPSVNSIMLLSDSDNNESDIKSYPYNSTTQLSDHFNVSEFKCKCGGTHDTLVSSNLVTMLEKLYKILNCSKIIINSAYRCSTHDKNVGGTGSGQHVNGNAADIVCYGKDNNPISTKVVSCVAQDLGFGGIGNIDSAYTAIHVDVRTSNIWYGNELINNNTLTDNFYNYYNITKEDIEKAIGGTYDPDVTVEEPKEDVEEPKQDDKTDNDDDIIEKEDKLETDKPVIELYTSNYKVLNFYNKIENLSEKDEELFLNVYSSIEPVVSFNDIDNNHTSTNSSKIICNKNMSIIEKYIVWNLTLSNPFLKIRKSKNKTIMSPYTEYASIIVRYKRINPNIVDITSID